MWSNTGDPAVFPWDGHCGDHLGVIRTATGRVPHRLALDVEHPFAMVKGVSAVGGFDRQPRTRLPPENELEECDHVRPMGIL